MAIVSRDFFLFLRDHNTAYERHQRRSEGFPDESEHVFYNGEWRITIRSYVNNVFQAGVNETFPALPACLAPDTFGIYDMELSRAAMDPRVLIIWRKLTPYQRRRHHAQFTVMFAIPSRRPYSVVHLAFFLLRFTYLAIRTYVTRHYDFDIHKQPQMRALAYHLSSGRAYGIAFYDYIDDVYDDAVASQPSYPQYHANPIAGLPITTWPPVQDDLVAELEVLRCYYDATALARA